MYLYTPIGGSIESSVAAVKTVSLPAGANGFLVQALGQNVRITLDNSDPTASTGLQLKAGDPVRLLALGGGGFFKVLQEAATAYFYCQPVRVDWVGP